MEMKNAEPIAYSPAEAMKLLKISRGLMYEAIRTGQIPSVRIGRRILIPRSGLERLLDKGSAPSGEARDPIAKS